ncbi:MAG: radical SAM protein [Ignavibacteriaceae bacterium]
MTRNTKVTFNPTKSSTALTAQTGGIYPYGFPFTLNPTMGCFFCCKFCYSPISLCKLIKGNRDSFFEEVTVRLGVPEQLDKELSKYSILPQHLKRVQINEHSEYYLPQLFTEIRDQNQPDTLLEILNIFQRHWDNGNKWMPHILTKSPLILKHLDKLKEMKEMVQVEISFSTEDENKLRSLEIYTPTIKKRLDTIEKLSKEGIFVRVMAMPFYGNSNDLNNLKQMAFARGAVAIKNKGLNYYNWQDVVQLSEAELIDGKLIHSGSRKDTPINVALNIQSGEPHLISGKTHPMQALMPNHKGWNALSKLDERLSMVQLDMIDCGYAKLNKVDWGYIK